MQSSSRILSSRPETTARLMAETGLSEEMLRRIVHAFYEKVRRDDLLGPIFRSRIGDWGPHLDRMVDFWSSVALMTGRYHGAPVPAHADLPIEWRHFERWLSLFRETARQICPTRGADHLIERAERIARSLHIAVGNARSDRGAVPILR